MSTRKLIALSLFSFILSSCEVCYECIQTLHDGTCTCVEGSSSTSYGRYNLTALEADEFKSDCEGSSICSYTEEIATTEDEKCGRRKNVEFQIDLIDEQGWECTEK